MCLQTLGHPEVSFLKFYLSEIDKTSLTVTICPSTSVSAFQLTFKKTIKPRELRNQPPGNKNLMRILRRRLGLSQRELAYVLGHDSHGYIAMIESGSRTPLLAEVLVIELVFGIPAVTIFPQIRQAVGQAVSHRVKRLTSELIGSSIHARRSYKTAQLERVLASLRTRDDFDQSGPKVWQA